MQSQALQASDMMADDVLPVVTLQALLRWFLHFGLRSISLPTPEPAEHSIRPEGFKSVRRHRRVAHGVLNVLVPQIVLNRSGIMPVRG